MCFFFKCLCSCKENLRKFLACKWNLFENFNAGAVSQRKRKKSSTSRFFHLHLVGFFIVTITNSSSQSNTTTTTSSSWHFNLQQCSKHCSLVVPTALRPGPYYIISVFMRVIHITCVCECVFQFHFSWYALRALPIILPYRKQPYGMCESLLSRSFLCVKK